MLAQYFLFGATSKGDGVLVGEDDDALPEVGSTDPQPVLFPGPSQADYPGLINPVEPDSAMIKTRIVPSGMSFEGGRDSGAVD